MSIKPILFNTNMVRAILDDKKTCTRRVIKNADKTWELDRLDNNSAMIKIRANGEEYPVSVEGLWAVFEQDGLPNFPMAKSPYQPGDILWVRETWAHPGDSEIARGAEPNMYLYKADPLKPAAWDIWHPSIHMPKEAARIWLRVTDVRVERLQKISGKDILMEGVDNGVSNPAMGKRWENMQRMKFEALWNSTIKPADLPLYGWTANPWVWVIEFERCEKPKEGQNERA